MQPSLFFQALQDDVQKATSFDAFGLKLVNRSRKSLLHSQMSVPRSRRPPFVMTRTFFCCFLDIQLCNAMHILGVSERVMRQLRTWCGVSRWPKHDLNLQKSVLHERLKLMKEICESDPHGYEMLYQAHESAGYKMDRLPKPRDFDAEGKVQHDVQETKVKPAYDEAQHDFSQVTHVKPKCDEAQHDFSHVTHVKPKCDEAHVTKVKLPSLEERMGHVEKFIHNKFLPAVGGQAQAEAEQPAEPFAEWDKELDECLAGWDDLDGVDYSILLQ